MVLKSENQRSKAQSKTGGPFRKKMNVSLEHPHPKVDGHDLLCAVR